jgi:filamentous hemagglutinin family protein
MVIKRDGKHHGAQAKNVREPRLFTRTLLSVSVALALSTNNVLADPPRGAFPRPCGGGACSGAGVPTQWRTSGSANSPYIAGNTMTIEQTSRNATFNWRSFDIGADNTVEFVQPSNTSVALNRVWDPSSNPTQIFGALNANGQVYIVNRNGILFGKGAKVDVHTLVATSLEIDDDVLTQGLASIINKSVGAAAFKALLFVPAPNPDSDGNSVPGRFKVDVNGAPVLAEDGSYISDPDGQLVLDSINGVPLMTGVTVQEGAVLKSQSYGTIMLLGANVTNDGSIETPDGQTILAAGNKVYLQSDSELRGFLVEVDVDAVSNDQLAKLLADPSKALPMGKVSNSGTVSAPRGNVTLVGLAINQEGRLSATSAVTANGSVRLLARDTVIASTGSGIKTVLKAEGTNTSRAGLVTFAEGSYTGVEIDTEKAGDKAVDEQAIKRSTVSVMGRQIELLSGSEIFAPSGDVSLTALADPRNSTSEQLQRQLQQEDNVFIRLEAGSRIDVSGVTTEVAMERNVVEAELRGNELADSPLQRDGVLAGQKVLIDVRTVDEDGRIPIANVSNAVAAIERTVAERSTTGGNVTIDSTGSAEFQPGAEIDVSGGAVQYRDGYINTTQLIADGQVYGIADADPNRRYDSILYRTIVKSEKWDRQKTYHTFGSSSAKGRFEEGYVEGKDAGTVAFSAYDPTINGKLIGERQVGRYQREAGKVPNGGELIIGRPEGTTNAGANFRTPDVMIAQREFIDALAQQSLLPDDLVAIDTAFLDEGGFTRASIYSNGAITLAEDTPLRIAPADSYVRDGKSNLSYDENGNAIREKTKLNLTAAQIDIKSSIDAPAGSISLNSVFVDPAVQGANTDGQRITLGDDVSLSARGLWANDQIAAVSPNGAAPDLNAPALIDGGSIALTLDNSGEIDIGDRVTMDVSAGAWLQGNGDLKAGKGGTLSINTRPGNNRDYRVRFGNDLTLRGYALQQGGTLSLKLPEIIIQDGGVAWATGQRNTLAALLAGERDMLAQQTLTAWQQQLNGETPTTDAQVHAVLDKASLTLKDDGTQTAEEQEALALAAIDAARLPLVMSTEMFQQGGFGRYDIGATTGDLIVAADSHLHPQMQNLVLDRNYQSQASGTDLAQFSRVERLADELRKPTDLTLSVSSYPAASVGYLPELRMEEGASIETDPEAGVVLSSSGRLDVNGRISAPAGSIKLEVNSNNEDYDAGRMLHLGEQAELSVAGIARLQPNELSLRSGDVLAGGVVEMTALGGGIEMEQGALVDVSGSEAVLDIPGGSLGTEATTIASAAGSITAMATESIRLDGELKGESNRAAGAAGGTLSLMLDPLKVPGATTTAKRGELNYPQPKDPQTNQDLVWTIRLSQQSDPGAEIGTGLASLAVDKLTGGGFDAVKLSTPGQIQFDGDVDMRLGRGIVLDAPQLTAKDNTGETQQVVLDAPYLSLGADFTTAVARDRQTVSDLQPVGGGGRFVAGAGNTHLIDLVGKTVLQGFSATELNSLGDIRLRSVLDEYSNTRTPPAAYIPSGFNTAGSLTLTASQVYPTTLSRFTLASADVSDGADVIPGRIVIEPGVAEPAPVLSVAGKITLDASIIENKGVLKAPLGEIQLGADDVTKTQSVTLAPGSITSTAADVEQVPFGSTLAGTIWQYDGGSTIAVYNEGVGQFTSEGMPFDAIPDQRITLRAQNVDIQDGATVDVHGGGDAVAYEFLPGPGGSRDVLNTANATADGRYVILPWLKDGYAPYDAQAFKGWDLDAGASVEILKAGNGLEAGVYPLLPASYALLPGAYLVTMENGYRDLNASHSTRLLDGTAVVPARMAVANTTVHDARTLGLTVRKGDYANALAEYDKTTLSQFLPEHGALDEVAIPRLPQDAGTLVIDATRSIALDGNMISNAAPGGRGAQVDIVADQLEIVTQFDETATAVQLDAADLNNFGAESILVGGTRASEADGVRIAVGAERVTVKSGVELEAPELILVAGAEDAASPEAATAGVHVESGATLRGKGEFSGRASNVTIGKEKVYDDKGNLVDPGVSGGGALLRVASANQISVRRANSETGTGALSIAEGATIGADESMVLDATGASQIEGTLDISGGSLNLGAEKVSLGDVPADTAGLIITNADLSNWALRELVLTSRGNIDFHGDVNFGTDTAGNTLLQSLAFETTGLQNHGGDTTVTAGSIRLTSPIAAGQGEEPVTGDSGTLTLNARVMNDAGAEPREIDGTGELLLGSGDFSVAGYAQANFNAERRITSEGEGQLRVAADVNLDAPLLTAGAGARAIIDAGNHAVTIASSTASDEAGNLGGSLAIKGGTVEHNGNIRVRSGRVDLQARAGDVVMKDGSVIDVSGISKQFDDVTVDTWGGKVALRADDGNVDVQSGSLIDVAGADSGGGADAGSLSVQALGEGENGKVTLAGTLHGDAQDGFAQGSFDVDARELVAGGNGVSGFSELNRTLNSGGFSERRAVRLRSGDITVEAGVENAVAARNVTLTADGADANIIVNGSVGLAAEKGGAVSLNAQGDVTLADGAEVIASAQGDGERGGKVLLSSDHGVITVSSGSRIDTSASAVGDGRDGSVTLRAARKDSDGDGQDDGVNIAPIAGTVTGAAKVVAEAVKVYANDGDVTIDAAKLAGWKAATQDFMDQHGVQIAADLDPAGQLPLTVSPGVEVRSTGTITLADEWDLSAWRYGDAPGTLTLRAQNNMQLDKSITDGFRANVLQSDDSWSYRIISGADTGSANMLAVLPTEQLTENGGNVVLAANSKVRTGNGSIDVVAGGNVELKDTSAVIYTAGVPATQNGEVVASSTISSSQGYVWVVKPAGGSAEKIPVSVTKNWLDQGGDLQISAAQDLIGVYSNYSPGSWLWREGGKKGATSYGTQWAVDFNKFQQGSAAFGGGDIRLTAGRDIVNFSSSIPTTGKQSSPGADRSVIDIWGGGDLMVTAEGDILGGNYLVGRGSGNILAGGSITTDGTVRLGKNVHTLLALGEGGLSVRAGGDLTIETVAQPTAIPRTAFGRDTQYTSYFLIYDPSANVDLVSLGGDLTLQPTAGSSIAEFYYDTKVTTSYKDTLNILPPTLSAAALEGSVGIPTEVYLLPSEEGRLRLLAEKNVGSASSVINMSDYDPEQLPTPSAPVISFNELRNVIKTHAPEPVHIRDNEPAYIVANTGDIKGKYVVPKQAHVVAGRDINRVGLYIQNINPTDVTLIEAGRDIRFTQSSALSNEKIQVDGPGRVDVIAGRNLNLGASDGITTRGNQANSALPDGGADVNVLVGVANGLNYDAFIQTYLVDSEVYRSDVTSYMRTRLDQPELSDADALQAFLDAPVIDQRPLIMQTLYAELNAAGIAASNGTGSYESGYEAIDTLFDSERGYDGDLSMYLSRIYTLDGGDINLAVPGGEVNAGLAVSTSSIGVPKEPDQLGIVAQRQGSVSAMVDKSFIVNQSRVFTLGGGDLMLWSSYGDIDAGRGAKSAISAPEPVYITDSSGTRFPDFGGAISGSGIRVISTLPGVEAGTTYLWAPEGKIDAGDAGIEAGSNLFLGAQQVIGTDNIKVGGASFGTPIAAAGNLAAGLSGVSSLASASSKSAQDSAAGNTGKENADTPLSDAALSFLEVEVLGFGAEQGTADQEMKGKREDEDKKE